MEVNGKKPTAKVAVVTGANKGIGMEIVKQLAGSNGIITVVLTARDVKRGTDATKSLHQIGFRNVVFHQLDVLDSLSIRNLVEFLDVKFGVLDILLSGKAAHLVQDVVKHTYEKAEECLNTNFYGVKATTEALLPLLKLSTHGARIVNISSLRGELQVKDEPQQ
ncbi:Salutaridine reductase [Linum perenne]